MISFNELNLHFNGGFYMRGWLLYQDRVDAFDDYDYDYYENGCKKKKRERDSTGGLLAEKR